MQTSHLYEFSLGVTGRMQRDGWVEIIVPIVMPLIAALIERCLNNRNALMGYVEGQDRTIGRQSVLRLQARSVAAEAGVRLMRRGAFARDLVNAIHAECDACSQRMSGDVYAEALAEVAELVS
jgi:hypothetical protein